MTKRRPLALGLALGLAACATTARAPEAVLVVRTPVPAQLFVDDVFAGAAAGRPLGLRAGTHRVEVRAEGMLPTYREVALKKGDRVTLEVPLRPDLDRDEGDGATAK